MSDLAPTIRPWSSWLQPLVPELAVGLGPMVERLAEALGPMPPRPEPGAVEPDGLSGIDRRGPYERLLLTEWALAEELPDEFLRRAASGEHLFLQLERTSPRGGRRCVVLFDAGPDQVGSPRLAHLALLPVFARRAEEAEATLVWGVLQRPGGEHHDVSGASYRSLLAGRSAERPTGAHHEAWAQQLDLGERDEVWVIGGPKALVGAGPSTVHLEVEEVLEPGPDELEVRVRRPGRPARVLRLPLPPPDARAALIRAPLRPVVAPSGPTPSRRPPKGRWGRLRPELRFSADGYRLLCREVEGAVVAFRVPGDPDDWRKPRRLEMYQAHAPILALGWGHRSVVVLRRTKDGLQLYGGRYGQLWTGPELAMTDVPTELVITQQSRRDVIWFRDAEQRLWRWPTGGPPTSTPSCLAIGRRDGRVLLVLAEEGRTRVVRGPPADRDEGHQVETQVAFRATRAVIGSGGGNGVGTVLLQSDHRWQFAPHDLRATRTHDAVPGARVIGAWGQPLGERGVFYLRGDRLVSRQLDPQPGPEVDLPITGPVVAAASSPLHYAQLCAWMEESGRIVFYDRRHGPMMALDPAEGS
ncbi:MAG: hypothetical protein H6738_22680 [Alphaproteobacteria bacterium]|nr:hypothetical protein [Alphaproteobacteria bacterium]